MKTPICFCNGVIRSGSTWSFNVCRGLLQEVSVQRKQPFGSAYLDAPVLEQFLTQHLPSIPGPTVIKAHMIGPAAMMALKTGQARAVCTFRDPRDCVASDVVFMGRGLEYSINRTANSLEFVRLYQSTPNIMLVKYEEMMTNRIGQIRRIAEHLEVSADEALIQRVDLNTNIESSKKVCGGLKNRPADQVLNIASHRVDPVTHLHEHHIGSAKMGRWRDDFSPAQGRWLTEYFSPWLLQLGYETQQSLRDILARPAPNEMPMTVPASTGPVMPLAGQSLLQRAEV